MQLLSNIAGVQPKWIIVDTKISQFDGAVIEATGCGHDRRNLDRMVLHHAATFAGTGTNWLTGLPTIWMAAASDIRSCRLLLLVSCVTRCRLRRRRPANRSTRSSATSIASSFRR